MFIVFLALIALGLCMAGLAAVDNPWGDRLITAGGVLMAATVLACGFIGLVGLFL